MNLNFAENLKQLRKAKEITQEKLADVLGVTGQTISRWELGICYPDLELLPAIANYFGVSIDMLLSNDASARERDFDMFCERLNAIPSKESAKRIEFVQNYCRKYPDNDYYAVVLACRIGEHLIVKPDESAQYMPLLMNTVQRLLETRYRTDAISIMAQICEEAELKKWMDMCPNCGFSKRDCLISRAETRGSAYETCVQGGLGMFETFVRELDWRYADALGAERKEEYQRSILRVIRSFGVDGDVPDGWKMYYAYKQFVLAACLFGQKKTAEGWENFDSALEMCKYVYAIDEQWLDIGGTLFSNLRVSKDWRNAIDETGQTHKLFAIFRFSFYDLHCIHDLLTNRRWAWFNSVRELEKYQAAVKWVEETKNKLESSET